ncbi:hypothetical protein WUBG_18294 [Wuchereria bancrofti]|uniref:Fucosyltransferase n=1 Tax=Wuchereria bancrofti TaxID=6293 RepID=J9DMT4_WUCBA|nr:hypothetical protein WUBG_18294 [Wuchereria bancrofti]
MFPKVTDTSCAKKSIYEDILPPGSFIAADDFKSPRELAEYLHYLLNNNTAYLSLFEMDEILSENIQCKQLL